MNNGIAQRIGAWDSRRREARLAAGTVASSEQGPPVRRGWARPRGEPADVLFALLAGDAFRPLGSLRLAVDEGEHPRVGVRQLAPIALALAQLVDLRATGE